MADLDLRRAQSTRILIVDPESALNDSALHDGAGLSVTRVTSVFDALALASRFKPKAIVFAIRGETSEECADVRRLSRCARALLVVTDAADASRITRLLKAGAGGYLFFADVQRRLRSALHDALSGGVPMSAAVARVVLERARRDSSSKLAAVRPEQIAAEPILSSRQLQVLELLAQGHSYEHIGVGLDLSVNTVRTHLRAIYERLGASSKVEAVLIARDLGLLDGRVFGV